MKNTIDLNLYRFLHLLFEQKTQVKVCHTLDISKATFNRHLNECRTLFSNELFNASGGRYEPTLFANQLMGLIQNPLEQLEQVHQLSQSFDELSADVEYQFFITNPLSTLLTSSLINFLRRGENHPKISFVDWSLEGIEQPKNGALSVGLSGYQNISSERVVERILGSLPIYVYLSRTHPLATHTEVSLGALQNLETVRVSMGALDDNTYYERLRKLHDTKIKQRLTVASTHAAIDCVSSGDSAFVCFDLSNQLPLDSVALLPLVHEGQAVTFDISMQFHRAYYQHPIIQQLDSELKALIKST